MPSTSAGFWNSRHSANSVTRSANPPAVSTATARIEAHMAAHCTRGTRALTREPAIAFLRSDAAPAGGLFAAGVLRHAGPPPGGGVAAGARAEAAAPGEGHRRAGAGAERRDGKAQPRGHRALPPPARFGRISFRRRAGGGAGARLWP